jgi:hypothetical protein
LKINKLMLPLAGLGFAILTGDVAIAASPAYCALYAREYASVMVQEGAAPDATVTVQDQAYYRCLNRDEDPAMPTASAYFGTNVTGEGADAIGEGDISGPTEAASVPIPRPAPAVTTASTESPGRRSRQIPWTPEWVAWCTSHFPNSFDLKTGTVIPFKTNNREFCN